MKGIEFEIHGKMAHFRKYYSNSTALSYHIPPVMTVKGMIAGLLGFERDSYYDLMSNDNCSVAIAVQHPLKKIVQTMNLMKVEKTADLAGTGTHSQNHTEWIIPENIREGDLCYRIVFRHKDPDIIRRLGECMVCTEPGYRSHAIALALGSAQCQAWITDGKYCELEEYRSAAHEEVITNFSVPVSLLERILPYNGTLRVKKEESITEFDSERYLTEHSKKSILVPVEGKPVKYVLKENVIYRKNEAGEVILFIEG